MQEQNIKWMRIKELYINSLNNEEFLNYEFNYE